METATQDSNFAFIRGSDRKNATINPNYSVRGKLQNRRCKLNKEINKELRLRAGAENLYKATENQKVKNRISLELSFVNSNLQLLKEKLSELNSSVEIYQNDSHEVIMPFIPIGLKETVDINFMDTFSERIRDHYNEEPNVYADAIRDITETRESARTPSRDANGINLIFRYYNLLYYVERRFFPYDRNGVYFEWYDSLTGIPSSQRTVAFEKACILFNLAGVYTQIATKQDRSTEKGLDIAVDNFLRAAGIFKHICETFTNAPSIDLKPQFLEILVALMLAQARECLYEKLLLQIESFSISNKNHIHRDLSGEAAQLMLEYNKINMSIDTDAHTYIPECWAAFVPLKAEYYKALAHYHAAISIDINNTKTQENSKRDEFRLSNNNSFALSDLTNDTDVNPCALKKGHIKESITCYEEALRLQRMSRDLKNKVSLTKMLKESSLKAMIESECIDEELKNNDFNEDDTFDMIDLSVTVTPSSKFILSLTDPDFTAYKIDDPFKKLGPLAIFSAKRHWTVPRSVCLKKASNLSNIDSDNVVNSLIRPSDYSSESCSSSSSIVSECSHGSDGLTLRNLNRRNMEFADDYGFKLRGDSPVIISVVVANSLADLGGLKEGDFIVELSGVDVKWYTQHQLVKLIQNSKQSLELKVITPIDRNYLKPLPTPSTPSTTTSKSSISTSRSTGSAEHRTKKKVSSDKQISSWKLFRRSQSLGKLF
ncbi:rhophilin-2-A [Contarinia nasturtii]|uniref:rhophilin-2-A n=1 Tax=Contarinia nasturtii TaxID=265458 RepID=UPI0012D44121|nr:rhophilin-2-A [Contarinia nasturtii]XP_031627707.1 rhophilin-2-A [Contarinia nasturtii]